MISKQDLPRSLSHQPVDGPRFQAAIPQDSLRGPLSRNGLREPTWLRRLTPKLYALAWLGVLVLTIQFLGWMFKRVPETPIDISLRRHGQR